MVGGKGRGCDSRQRMVGLSKLYDFCVKHGHEVKTWRWIISREGQVELLEFARNASGDPSLEFDGVRLERKRYIKQTRRHALKVRGERYRLAKSLGYPHMFCRTEEFAKDVNAFLTETQERLSEIMQS